MHRGPNVFDLHQFHNRLCSFISNLFLRQHVALSVVSNNTYIVNGVCCEFDAKSIVIGAVAI